MVEVVAQNEAKRILPVIPIIKESWKRLKLVRRITNYFVSIATGKRDF